MARIADTSAIYALFSKSDAHHDRAVSAFEDPEPIQIPGEILSELIGLVHYRHGKKRATTVLQELMALPHTHLRPSAHDTHERAMELYRHPRRRLSYADAIVSAACLQERTKPLTFDKGTQREASYRPSQKSVGP